MKLFFYVEFHTKAYDDLINELEGNDVELTFRSNEQKIGFGMVMN